MGKKQFNVRLEEKTIAEIEALAAEMDVSQADVIKLAVRQLAKRELLDSARPRKKGPTS